MYDYHCLSYHYSWVGSTVFSSQCGRLYHKTLLFLSSRSVLCIEYSMAWCGVPLWGRSPSPFIIIIINCYSFFTTRVLQLCKRPFCFACLPLEVYVLLFGFWLLLALCYTYTTYTASAVVTRRKNATNILTRNFGVVLQAAAFCLGKQSAFRHRWRESLLLLILATAKVAVFAVKGLHRRSLYCRYFLLNICYYYYYLV